MKIIDLKVLEGLSQKASASQRKRMHRNYHESYDERVQRLLNLIHADSYIRPHRHKDPEKFEVFIILSGSVEVIEFNNDGSIRRKVKLDRDAGNFTVELPPQVYHTVVSLEDGSTVYEIKPGPFEPEDDKEFAPWAPAEGSAGAGPYLDQLKKA